MTEIADALMIGVVPRAANRGRQDGGALPFPEGGPACEPRRPKRTVHHIVMSPLGTMEMLHCRVDYQGPAVGSYEWRKVTCEKCLMLKGK